MFIFSGPSFFKKNYIEKIVIVLEGVMAVQVQPLPATKQKNKVLKTKNYHVLMMLGKLILHGKSCPVNGGIRSGIPQICFPVL